MYIERAKKILAEYGLSEKEALVYINLLQQGPTKASLLARAIGLSRVDTYRILDRLVNLGLAEASAGRPILFSASPASDVLDRLIGDQRRRLEVMESNRSNLQEELKKLARTPSPVEHRFRIVQGRKQIYNLLSTMFASSQKKILILSTGNDLIRLKIAGLDDVLQGAASRGVEVKVFTEVDKRSLEAASRFFEFTSIRHTELTVPGRLVVVDGAQSLSSIVLDDDIALNIGQDIGLWTDAQQYVSLVNSLFEEAYSNASEAAPLLSRFLLEAKMEKVAAGFIEQLANRLRRRDWDVKVPGMLMGTSNIEHTFDLTAKSPIPSEATLVFEVNVADEAVRLEENMPFFAKIIDCNPVKAFLVAVPALEEKAKRLASLYQVSVVEGEDASVIASNVDESLQ